jgi:hypothetical protein
LPREWCAPLLRRRLWRKTRTRHKMFPRKGPSKGGSGGADVVCLSLRCPSRSKEETRNHVRHIVFSSVAFSLSRLVRVVFAQ